jgi:hypothetical protein
VRMSATGARSVRPETPRRGRALDKESLA